MISKVVGVLEEQKADNSVRIKVLRFKKDNEVITRTSLIKEEFPPFGYVFAPKFFDKFTEFQINSLLEFSISSHVVTSSGHKYDRVLMDINKNPKKIGFEVVVVNDNIMENEFAINQPLLRTLVHINSSNFYIKNGNYLYGPFKCDNDEIIAKKGNEVNKYDFDKSEFIGDTNYLLSEPTNLKGSVDCMTRLQLTKWLKTQIDNLNIKIDFTLLKRALESQELKELDKARMIRALRNIDNVSISIEQLKILAGSSETLSRAYEKQLEKVRKEIRDEIIEPITKQESDLKEKINNLNNSNFKLKKENEKLEESSKKLNEEFSSILKEKNRLIEDIKIHSAVNNSKSFKLEKLYTYEEQNYISEGDSYKNIVEFADSFMNSIDNHDTVDKRTFLNCISQLSESNFILCDDVKFVFQISKLSNNCRTIIQQVEADWLKFEYFYENGLKQACTSAVENPTQIHFLILEDINLASIECYGKPVLDILAGIRNKLPGLSVAWQSNLWIFGVPLAVTKENNFGLPLIEETFENCGAFKRTNRSLIFNSTISKKVLHVNQLINTDPSAQNFLKEYFTN